MKSIAVVEDNQLMREAIIGLLAMHPGLTVHIDAENGVDLIRKLNVEKKLPNVVFLDIEMPVMDGIATTNYLRRHYPAIRIIAISHHTNIFVIQDIINAGAHGYIMKENLKPNIIGKVMQSLINDEIYIDDGILFIASRIPNNICRQAGYKDLLKLSEKELTFLELCVTNISYDQIADIMNVANETIYNYQKSLKAKLGLGARHEFILFALRNGIAKVARLK